MKNGIFRSLAVAAAAALAGCSHGGPPGGMMGGGGGGFAFPVSAAPLTRGDIVQTFTVTGSVAPLLWAPLSSVASGTVMSVGAQIGEPVSQGQLLVQIDDSQLRAQLAQSQAALESAQARLIQTTANDAGNAESTDAGFAAAKVADDTARANYERTRTLFTQGFVSQSALDTAQQQLAAADAALRAAQVGARNARMDAPTMSAGMADTRSAQAAVDQAAANVKLIQAQLAQTQVRAPFDGVVVDRRVDPGALASPGSILMEVAKVDRVYVNAGVSGNELASVRVGTPATVTVTTLPGRSWSGKVDYLNEGAQPGTLTYMARITIANPDGALRASMVADVAFEQAHRSGVILAPRSAVYETDAGFAMYVIADGKAKAVPVVTGLEDDRQIEVAGQGLAPGVQAIENHAATLQPGMPVQVLPPQGGQHR